MKNPFLRNGRLKLMALVLSVLAWSMVKQITSYDRVVSGVPLDLQLPEGWAVKDRSSSSFAVTFHGTREDLLLLDARTILMRVDLREESFTREKTIELTGKSVSHTGNATVAEISPAEITVLFDQEVQKTVPVNVNIQGDLQLGIRVETAEAVPKLVQVSGARESLESITSLQTAPVDLTGRIQSFEQRVDVIPPDESWSGSVSPPDVRVKVTLVGVKEQRTFPDVPVQVMSQEETVGSSGWTRSPAVVDIILQGRGELIEALGPDEIRAYVLANGAGTARSKVLVHVPAGIDVLAIQPDAIRLERVQDAPPQPAVSRGASTETEGQ